MTRVGRYELLGEVARGGMGVVHRGRAPDGSDVAVKLLLAGRSASPLQRRRAETEVQSLLRLRHPGVVALVDAGEQEGIPYLVMEWIEGETLAARLRRQGPLDPDLAVELVSRLALALEHCHAQGVLHRDLKPGNVLLRASDGEPLLTDFGLSKDVACETQSTLLHTVAGRWLGTPGWWPPEQARGELEAVGPRSDVYGLGAILYAVLTGVAPQGGGSAADMLAALERPPVPPGQRRPGLPAWLDAVCLRALARDPAARQAGPAELRRELEAGMAAGAPRPVPGWAVAAALLLGAAVAASGLFMLAPQPQPEPGSAAAPPASDARPGPPHDSDLARRQVEEALAHAKRGEHREAIACWDRALALDPRDVASWGNRGLSHERLGQLELAIADYDQVIALTPEDARAHRYRGRALEQLERPEAAIEAYDRVLELEPRDAATRVDRGVLRAQLNRLDGAIEDLERALALEPEARWAAGARAELERLKQLR